ncbi:hypothetical protein GCM10023353_10530 [Tomitella cavernea]|uniref:Uncharacterized protein n=1 Tax=Tomitella cavernea TaxID=1387982 RepID=A0ABP9CFV3_9ACTN
MTDDADRYSQDYLDRVEEPVGWYTERGYKVMPDLHQDVYSGAIGSHGAGGNGAAAREIGAGVAYRPSDPGTWGRTSLTVRPRFSSTRWTRRTRVPWPALPSNGRPDRAVVN